jgi:hypothetical protein
VARSRLTLQVPKNAPAHATAGHHRRLEVLSRATAANLVECGASCSESRAGRNLRLVQGEARRTSLPCHGAGCARPAEPQARRGPRPAVPAAAASRATIRVERPERATGSPMAPRQPGHVHWQFPPSGRPAPPMCRTQPASWDTATLADGPVTGRTVVRFV